MGTGLEDANVLKNGTAGQTNSTALSATPVIIVAVGFLGFIVVAICYGACRDECHAKRRDSKTSTSRCHVSIEMSLEESMRREQQELSMRRLNQLISQVNGEVDAVNHNNNNYDSYQSNYSHAKGLRRSVSTIQATVHASFSSTIRKDSFSQSLPRYCRQCSERAIRTPALTSSRLYDDKITYHSTDLVRK